MTDERRERYEAPLFEIMRANGWDGEYTEQVRREMALVVDAVIVVADEELADLHTDLQQNIEMWRLQAGEAERENARLRAEIGRVRDALDFCDRGSAVAIRAALEEESE